MKGNGIMRLVISWMDKVEDRGVDTAGCMSDRWDSGRITGDECNGYNDMQEGMKVGSVCMGINKWVEDSGFGR